MTQPELNFSRRETAPERRHRNTRSAQVRALLSDLKWHASYELDGVAAHRFGGAIERIRKGLDKGPIWEILSERLSEDGQKWRYRWTGAVLESPQLIRAPKSCPNCGCHL